MEDERSAAPATAADKDSSWSEADEPERQPGLLARFLGFGGDSRDDEDSAEWRANADERALFTNIRTMRGQRVEDIMIPRADIVAVEVDASLDELTEAYRAGAHSRLPVYRETLDDPIGFVHVKDVALARGFGRVKRPAEGGDDADDANEGAPFLIRSYVREMMVVPPSMPTSKLLQRMQKSRIHMALVVDEYGGVDGLVTIEDLVEQIVGDIDDEHDEAEDALWRIEAPGVYVASARAELSDFEEEAGVDLLPDDLDEDVDTLGGLVFMLANRIPERGEVIEHPQGHEFEVIDADPRRISRLRVRLNGAQPLARAAE